MKERTSFTCDKETIELIDCILEAGDYRNKSHVVEKAIKELALQELNLKKGGKNNVKSK